MKAKFTFIWKDVFGPLSNSPFIFLLSPGKMLLMMFLFQKWLGSLFPKKVWAWWLLMHWLQLQFTHCEALKCLKWLCLTVFSSLRSSLLLVHIFRPNFFLPVNFAFNMLWYSTPWTDTPFSNDPLWLTLFVEGVNDRLLDHCQVSSVPHYCGFKEQDIPIIYTVWSYIETQIVNILILPETTVGKHNPPCHLQMPTKALSCKKKAICEHSPEAPLCPVGQGSFQMDCFKVEKCSMVRRVQIWIFVGNHKRCVLRAKEERDLPECYQRSVKKPASCVPRSRVPRPPKQPTHSRLDEWFLPGRSQAPCQWASPFFPEDHSELTKSWHAPYLACLSSNSCSALSSVDGTEEKGYEKMPPLNEAVTAHLCLPTAFGWKAKVAHPSNPCRRTSALAGRAYSSAGQTASRPCMSQDLTPAAFRYFLVNWKVMRYFTSYLKKVYYYVTRITVMRYPQHWS